MILPEPIDAHFSASDTAEYTIDEFIVDLILLILGNENGIGLLNSDITNVDKHEDKPYKLKVYNEMKRKM